MTELPPWSEGAVDGIFDTLKDIECFVLLVSDQVPVNDSSLLLPASCDSYCQQSANKGLLHRISCVYFEQFLQPTRVEWLDIGCLVCSIICTGWPGDVAIRSLELLEGLN